jgi:methylisocitrate lyase
MQAFGRFIFRGRGWPMPRYGLPDLGITTLNDVLEDVRRLTAATKLPLLVDVDTGWGGAFLIARTVREMIRAGAAAIHIEDQVQSKRCGHRPGKALVAPEEMVDRVKSAMDGRDDASFVIMARTDAYSVEGLSAAVERAARYVEAGADMIFAEAMTTLDEYRNSQGRSRRRYWRI